MMEAHMTCPECRKEMIHRVNGVWCRFCRGWLLSYQKSEMHEVRYIGFVKVL